MDDVVDTTNPFLDVPEDLFSLIGTGGSFDPENMALMHQPIEPWRPYDQAQASIVSDLMLTDGSVDLADEVLGDAIQGSTAGHADEVLGQDLRHGHLEIGREPTTTHAEPTSAESRRQTYQEVADEVLAFLDGKRMWDLYTSSIPDLIDSGPWYPGRRCITDPPLFVGRLD